MTQLREHRLISPELSERLALHFESNQSRQPAKQEVEAFLTKDQQAEVGSADQILWSKMGIQLFCNLFFRGLPLDLVYEIVSAGHFKEADGGDVLYSRGQGDRLGSLGVTSLLDIEGTSRLLQQRPPLLCEFSERLVHRGSRSNAKHQKEIHCQSP